MVLPAPAQSRKRAPAGFGRRAHQLLGLEANSSSRPVLGQRPLPARWQGCSPAGSALHGVNRMGMPKRVGLHRTRLSNRRAHEGTGQWSWGLVIFSRAIGVGVVEPRPVTGMCAGWLYWLPRRFCRYLWAAANGQHQHNQHAAGQHADGDSGPVFVLLHSMNGNSPDLDVKTWVTRRVLGLTLAVLVLSLQ